MFSHDEIGVTYFLRERPWRGAVPFSAHRIGDTRCQCLLPGDIDSDHVVKVVPASYPTIG